MDVDPDLGRRRSELGVRAFDGDGRNAADTGDREITPLVSLHARRGLLPSAVAAPRTGQYLRDVDDP